MTARVEFSSSKELREREPRFPLVGIFGPTGAGKTTLARLLEEHWGATIYEEKYIENPHLKPFYEDPPAHSFNSQMFFLDTTFEQIMELKPLLAEGMVIQDPTIRMHRCYAKTQYEMGWMSKRQWLAYESRYIAYTQQISVPKPDITLVPVVSEEGMMRWIKRRGRDFEMRMSAQNPDYFRKLARNCYREIESGREFFIKICLDEEREDEEIAGRINSTRIVLEGRELARQLSNFTRRTLFDEENQWGRRGSGPSREKLITPPFMEPRFWRERG